jgi:periplasmic protein TonB
LHRMKSASFFIVSVTLHLALLLAYPTPHSTYLMAEFMPVTVLSFGAAESGAGNDFQAVKAKITTKPTRAFTPKIEPNDPESIQPAISTARNQPSVEAVQNIVSHIVVGSSPMLEVTESARFEPVPTHEKSSGAGGDGSGISESDRGVGGEGLGLNGSGTGNGVDTGHGNGSVVMQLTQVSFRHAPPPKYPDAARKDGKEGRVLLRVLVDEEGKSKLVEISLSSGSHLLDQAAAEAIKRWRFSPARYRDSPTASWVKIPVDFRLKEAR